MVISPRFWRQVNPRALVPPKIAEFSPPPPFVIEISHQQRTLAMVQAPFVP